MHQSIFSRLFSTHLAIFLAFIIALSIVLSILYSNQVYEQEHNRLSDIAKKTESLYLSMQNGVIDSAKMQHYMDAMAYVSKAKIYLLNLDQSSLEQLRGLELSNEDLDTYLYRDLHDILDGNEVIRNSQYSTTFETQMVFYGRPLISDGNILGAVILFSPNQNVVKNITIMVSIIIGIALISIIIVGVLIYINARQISRLIQQVRNSVMRIANGEATASISYSGYKELTALTEAFNYMNQELDRIDLDKRNFISMISHEIKTPLTVISGHLEAIHDGVFSPEEIQDSLDIIYRETRRLTGLTQSIVSQTRGIDTKIYLEPSIFKLKPLLQEISRLSESTSYKTVHISISCSDDLTLYADANKIRQILANLISNSMKYSNTTVNIAITCYTATDQLLIQIQDDGIGIKKSDLEHIFEQYFRVQYISDLIDGNGLGLSIVKKIMVLHQGTIGIESEYKKGTVVTLTFPL